MLAGAHDRFAAPSFPHQTLVPHSVAAAEVPASATPAKHSTKLALSLLL